MDLIFVEYSENLKKKEEKIKQKQKQDLLTMMLITLVLDSRYKACTWNNYKYLCQGLRKI